MSEAPGERASDLAARQVEQIVSAAQAAAEQIRVEAQAEVKALLDQARRSGQEELKDARREAILLEKDARRDAAALLNDAEDDAAQVREKARRAVDGRVVAAERAAAEVLEEARALSGGLNQLGKALEAHADRILRDVTAAHKRMQSDLRVGGGLGREAPERGRAVPADGDGGSAGGPPAPYDSLTPRSRPEPDTDRDEPVRSKRGNPFEEIDVPDWVGREP